MTITQELCRTVDSDGADVTFHGQLLGESSTQHRSGGLRWFEIRIFRNDDDGRYAVSKIGKTMVYHQPGCSSLRLPIDVDPEIRQEPPEDWFGCPKCEPHLSDQPVALERDRVTLRSGLIAFEVLEALRQRNDETGEWFISMTARLALRDAIERDDELARAYARDTLTRHR